MKRFINLTLLCASFLVQAISAADSDIAKALAASGALFASKGDIARAEDILFRSLAIDSECGDALFELAKIYDAKKDYKIASSFYARSIPRVDQKTKSSYAMSRLLVINKAAYDLIVLMERHAKAMEDVFRKFPDKTTYDEIQDSCGKLNMSNIIPKSSAPFLDVRCIPQPEIPVVGHYYYVGPWWRSDFEIREDHTFMRIPVMIGGTWTLNGNTLSLKHSDKTLDVLVKNQNGYSNSRVSISIKLNKPEE